MLKIENIEVVYQTYILVLKGLSLEAAPGAITALIGTNGAGKTTTLKAISGLLGPEDGAVISGRIEYDGQDITHWAPEKRVAAGLVQIMEGRRIFQDLTVAENLDVGGYLERSRSVLAARRELVYSYFPRLQERRQQIAGYMSGGEQQMLAIGRALMSGPKFIMLDEPSMGLAPILVREVFEIVQRLRDEQGLSILLVEQNARAALGIADHGFVMEDGKVVLDGPASDLRSNQDVQEFYLGVGAGDRGHFRNIPWYRRKKRWV